jgi:hypothetical protein
MLPKINIEIVLISNNQLAEIFLFMIKFEMIDGPLQTLRNQEEAYCF